MFDRRLMNVVGKDPHRGGLSAEGQVCQEVGCLVIMSEHVVELEVFESFLKPVNFFVVGTHLVISECRTFHDLVDDELGVASHMEALCP